MKGEGDWMVSNLPCAKKFGIWLSEEKGKKRKVKFPLQRNGKLSIFLQVRYSRQIGVQPIDKSKN